MAQPQQVVFPPTNVFKLFDLEAATNVFTPSADSTSVLAVTDSTDTYDVFRVDTTNRAVFVGGAIASDSELYDPNINFYVTAEADSYTGLNVWNISDGELASACIIAANDSDAGYVSLEISSLENVDPDFAIMNGGVGACYSYNTDFVVGSGATDLKLFAGGFETTNIGATLAGTGGWTFNQDIVNEGDVKVQADDKDIFFGAGDDMSVGYDGSQGNIKTDLVGASDLHVDCGTAKTVVLDIPVYQDCNVGGLVLRTGGTAPGVVQILDNDGDNTGIYTVGFAVNEEGSGVVEVPHDYKEGTNLVFHVHWGANDAPTGTDNVRWQVTYSISRDDNTFPDSVTVAADDTPYDTQYEWLRTDVATITGSTGGVDGGNIKIGDQFSFSIKRIAASGDAFGGEALVGSIGFHYQTDTLGSRAIGTK